MADIPTVKSRRITRDKLATFLGSHELIKAFENLIEDVVVTIPEAVAAEAEDMDTVLKAGAFSRQAAPVPQTNDDAASLMAAQLFARPAPVAPPQRGDIEPIIEAQLFARQAPSPQAAPDASSVILAAQIFGA